MKYIELFAGIGGLGYGLMQAGMTCVGYVEIDKHAHKAYEILHDPRKEMWSAYDIRDVTDDDIRRLGRERGPISLIAAGFPCQAFSVAGKRKGFADKTRGTLFFEIVRFASILRPEFLLLENVDGLRTHDNGRTLGIILGTLDELGYVGGWQVLNSKDFGVPQNRERIFIVASLRNGRARKVFPIGRKNDAAIEVVGRIEGRGHDQNRRIYASGGLAPCLNTMGGGGQEPKVLVVGNTNPSGNGMNGNVFDSDGLSPTLTTNKGEGNKVLVNVSQLTGVTETDQSLCLDANCFKGLGANQHSGTFGISDGYRIRKLTPLECFRLQSWPDEWYVKLKLIQKPELIEQVDMTRNDITAQVMRLLDEHGVKEGISDSQLYKMAGNGVTSAVAYEIGRRIMMNSDRLLKGA